MRFGFHNAIYALLMKTTLTDKCTVIQNEYYTSRLVVFRFVHLNHLPKEKMTQMRYHLKALI